MQSKYHTPSKERHRLELAQYLGDIAVIAGTLAAVGLAIDKVISPRHDATLKDRLTAFWYALSEMNPRSIPRATAALYLRFIGRFIGEKFLSWRFLISSVAVSVLLTTIFFFVGKAVRHAILASLDPSYGSFYELLPGYIQMYADHLNKSFVYPINAVFDVLTVVITTALVMRFFRSRSLLRASGYIVLDLFTCALLFYVCLFLIVSNDLATAPAVGLLRFHQHILEKSENAAMFAHWISSGVFYSATIFYPTVVYLVIFFLITAAAMFAHLLKAAGMFYAESAVENDKSVFLVTGSFIGIFAAIAKGITDLVS